MECESCEENAKRTMEQFMQLSNIQTTTDNWIAKRMLACYGLDGKGRCEHCEGRTCAVGVGLLHFRVIDPAAECPEGRW